MEKLLDVVYHDPRIETVETPRFEAVNNGIGDQRRGPEGEWRSGV
jgi:hypothetical protein